MKEHQLADVFISGAGPVGLILAFHLTQLGHSVYIIDAVDKASEDHPMYGRACQLYPRTLEVLDQLDLYAGISQIGFASKRVWGYKDGNPIDRRWGIFDSPASMMDTTFMDTTLNIRLKYSEDVFRDRLANKGVQVHAPVKLVDFQLDQEASDGYQVVAACQTDLGESFNVKSRYIVGCDGGGSAVRRLAGIPFVGDRKLQYFVRIDGIVKTNIPEARWGLGAIESSTHGHVVWVALDHGATRVGYVLSDELFQRYGTKMSVEDAAYEAQKAVAPFELKFERVDWHTVYGIQQHVADRFQDRQRILLAGDAAHTHSSGSAQGMNTGVQDVANLSWRLAGVLKGWYRAEVLDDYSHERRSVALQLIDNDKTVSALVAQQKPKHLQSRPEHAHVLLDEFLRNNSGFTTGLAIEYGPSMLNEVAGSSPAIRIHPGQRVPDMLLQRPGIAVPKIRFYDLTKNNGKFRILVFTGKVEYTARTVQVLRAQVDTLGASLADAVDLMTIAAGEWHAFDEYLSVERLGMAYWDPDLSAHDICGVSAAEGAMLAVRPDGMLGLVSPLADFRQVTWYLDRIMVSSQKDRPSP